MNVDVETNERLDAIEAHLEILAGVFERLLAMHADIEHGTNAISATRSQIEALRRPATRRPPEEPRR